MEEPSAEDDASDGRDVVLPDVEGSSSEVEDVSDVVFSFGPIGDVPLPGRFLRRFFPMQTFARCVRNRQLTTLYIKVP